MLTCVPYRHFGRETPKTLEFLRKRILSPTTNSVAFLRLHLIFMPPKWSTKAQDHIWFLGGFDVEKPPTSDPKFCRLWPTCRVLWWESRPPLDDAPWKVCTAWGYTTCPQDFIQTRAYCCNVPNIVDTLLNSIVELFGHHRRPPRTYLRVSNEDGSLLMGIPHRGFNLEKNQELHLAPWSVNKLQTWSFLPLFVVSFH